MVFARGEQICLTRRRRVSAPDEMQQHYCNATLIARSTGVYTYPLSSLFIFSAVFNNKGGCARNLGSVPLCGCAACTRKGWQRYTVPAFPVANTVFRSGNSPTLPAN